MPGPHPMPPRIHVWGDKQQCQHHPGPNRDQRPHHVCVRPHPTLTKPNVGGEAWAYEDFESPPGDPEAREVEAWGEGGAIHTWSGAKAGQAWRWAGMEVVTARSQEGNRGK